MDRLNAALIDLPGVEVRIMGECGSTNAVLLGERGRSEAVLLATEEQTAGRGRRGRRWHSTPGADLTFSLASTLHRPVHELAVLSLVAGVAVTRALRAAGMSRVALKWPNDLVVDGAKLGGILVETRSEGSRTRAVFGVGINCRRSAKLETRLRRRIASLDQFASPGRNSLLREISLSLLEVLRLFEQRGFDSLRAEWEALDAHAGQRLRVRLADGRSMTGIACGLAEDGALRLRSRNGIRAVRSGRVVTARVA